MEAVQIPPLELPRPQFRAATVGCVHPPNVDKVLALVGAGRLLDVGGWAQPLNRADCVVDLLPFETRGQYGSIGPGPERFDASTWIEHDICGPPLPFDDDSFDFVVCSHVLEDIRDPLRVCREMVRVGKAGYVEVPSREIESTWGVEGRYAGYYHHRWLVELRDGGLVFRFKTPALLASRRLHLSSRHGRNMSEARRVTWLFWSGSFSYCEELLISGVATKDELAAYVGSVDRPNRARVLLSELPRTAVEARRVLARMRGRSPEPDEVTRLGPISLR